MKRFVLTVASHVSVANHVSRQTHKISKAQAADERKAQPRAPPAQPRPTATQATQLLLNELDKVDRTRSLVEQA